MKRYTYFTNGTHVLRWDHISTQMQILYADTHFVDCFDEAGLRKKAKTIEEACDYSQGLLGIYVTQNGRKYHDGRQADCCVLYRDVEEAQ